MYFENDETIYEERYKAINRNAVKKQEKTDTYTAHPTAPVGYAWDTHAPAEQANTK